MGEFLTIGYCFPFCFLEFLWGEGQGCDGGAIVVTGGILPNAPTRENPDIPVCKSTGWPPFFDLRLS